MSTLISETDSSLQIEEILSNDTTFYPDWILSGKYSDELVSALSMILYQIKVRYSLDKNTLKATIITVDTYTP